MQFKVSHALTTCCVTRQLISAPDNLAGLHQLFLAHTRTHKVIQIFKLALTPRVGV